MVRSGNLKHREFRRGFLYLPEGNKWCTYKRQKLVSLIYLLTCKETKIRCIFLFCNNWFLILFSKKKNCKNVFFLLLFNGNTNGEKITHKNHQLDKMTQILTTFQLLYLYIHTFIIICNVFLCMSTVSVLFAGSHVRVRGVCVSVNCASSSFHPDVTSGSWMSQKTFCF